LNTYFLADINYVNQIRTTIQQVRIEYENDDSISPDLLWEMMKLKSESSQYYMQHIKSEYVSKDKELAKRIDKLQNWIESNCPREKKNQSPLENNSLKKQS